MVASMKMAVFWVVAPCSLVEVFQCFADEYFAEVMEAASISKMSVNFLQTTWHYNQKAASYLHVKTCILQFGSLRLVVLNLRQSFKSFVLQLEDHQISCHCAQSSWSSSFLTGMLYVGRFH
jgi:hypothetical protein